MDHTSTTAGAGKRRPTKAYRKRDSRQVRTFIRLAPAERATLARVGEQFAAHKGFRFSHSLLFSMALEALAAEAARGIFRPHREAYLADAR